MSSARRAHPATRTARSVHPSYVGSGIRRGVVDDDGDTLAAKPLTSVSNSLRRTGAGATESRSVTRKRAVNDRSPDPPASRSETLSTLTSAGIATEWSSAVIAPAGIRHAVDSDITPSVPAHARTLFAMPLESPRHALSATATPGAIHQHRFGLPRIHANVPRVDGDRPSRRGSNDTDCNDAVEGHRTSSNAPSLESPRTRSRSRRLHRASTRRPSRAPHRAHRWDAVDASP